MFRVAALQFASTDDVDHNLATCLRMIDSAADAHRTELMVLPEFCNHSSWYDDREHALRAAVTLDGPFLSAIAARALRHRCTIVINCSVRREDDRITATSLMYGPEGQLLAEADKQTLIGRENEWFARAETTGAVVDAPKARLGLYAGRDGVTMETARCLALRGAEILCDSLSSFALDEASLHVPARASENRVFVVAANRVGPLIPPHLIAAVSEASFIPVPFFEGAGESQIVAPDGRVLAKGPRAGEAIVAADIEPSDADRKLRPDSTHIFEARRPELYRAIGMKPRELPIEPAAKSLDVASISIVDAASIDTAIVSAAEQVYALAQDGVELVVLPELFCFEGGVVTDPEVSAAFFVRAVRALAEACAGTRAHVVTSLVERAGADDFHMGVLVGQAGIVARQPQLHVPARHAWARQGRRLEVFRLPWGKISLLVGDDMIFLELTKVAALFGAHLIAAPCDLAESWELEFGLRARAAENRVCIAMATRPRDAGQSALFDLEREFTMLQPWTERVFDGRVSDPIVTRAFVDQGILRATLHPDAANNKIISRDTHSLDKRPWWLVSDLLKSSARPLPAMIESSESATSMPLLVPDLSGADVPAEAGPESEQPGQREGEVEA